MRDWISFLIQRNIYFLTQRVEISALPLLLSVSVLELVPHGKHVIKISVQSPSKQSGGLMSSIMVIKNEDIWPYCIYMFDKCARQEFGF